MADVPAALSQAPTTLVQAGKPRFGLWKGSVGNASFAGLQPPFERSFLARKLIEKKWTYTLVATPDLFFCMAIIDAGALHSAFLALFDRKSRTLLADFNVVLPPLFALVSEQPSALHAIFSAPGAHAAIEQLGAGVRVGARFEGCEVELRLDSIDEPSCASACADLGGARFDFTQKRCGLTASGTIVHKGRAFTVEDGRAGLDFTHGYLQRETAWRWAFGMGESAGRKLAFNFSEGFLEAGSENTLFFDGAPCSVGPIQFEFDRSDVTAKWTLRGEGVELTFTPEGLRRQNTWTPLLYSRYVQPFGSFSGYLTSAAGARLEVEGLAGVTEDHAAKW
jgi:hypothetical protein